jgi:dihydrofolate reductase
MTINAIMACDLKGGIARNGTLPWPKNIKDLQWFKKNTLNSTVIMGSKTWIDPMFPKPMKNRNTVVVSTQDAENYPEADLVMSGEISEIIEQFKNSDSWIIGGANIINQSINLIDFFYLTVHNEDYECDTFIPVEELMQWEKMYHEVDGNLEFMILKSP